MFGAVEYEVRIRRSIRPVSPIVEEELSVAGTFDALEKLLRDDLIRIYVHPIEGRDHAFV
jgi:hypothetical protein